MSDSDRLVRPATPEADNSTAPTSCSSIATTETPSVSAIKILKRKRKLNPMVEKALQSVTNLRRKVHQRDEFDVFGEYVAFQLRKLKSDRNKAIAKNQINKILFDLEMSELEELSSKTSRATEIEMFTPVVEMVDSSDENSV